ncbi:non-ribosomal peptide synthetase [Salinispora arenicola]|uniref:non-ribosomal peptide synthetase n=1 Tax=Salinispora arenicola TaxID=168697 RepID=UPI000366C955|nr:non-ribosomal peptide synthetase [Salinispora arenicola]
MNSAYRPALGTDEKSQLVQRWLARHGSGGTVTIPTADRAAPLRASFGQRRLWAQDRADEIGGRRNIPMAWRLGGDLDPDALFDALDLIVARHEALRISFQEDGAELWQTVHSPYRLERTVTPANSDIARQVDDFVYTPIDMTGGRLLRAMLLRITPQDHIFVLVTVHLALDDWTAGILWNELRTAYASLRAGDTPQLPELSVQYPDFTEWQRTRLESGALDASLDYWRSQLAGAPTHLHLPADRPRPAHRSGRAGWVSFTIPRAETEALDRLCVDERATPFMALLTAYAITLSRWAGTSDLLIGTPVAARTLPELEPLIGFFVNTLVLRVQIDQNTGFRSHLAAVRQNVLAALAHQEVPFDHLVQTLAPERSAAADPLVQVAFSLNNASTVANELAGLTVEEHLVAGRSSRYDLVLATAPYGEGLRAELVFDEELFERPTAERFAEQFRRILAAVVAAPNTPLLGLGRTAADGILDGPVRPFDADRCLTELVAQHAQRMPGQVAVRAADGELTYAELDRRSRALAGRLHTLGAGPERTVAVHLDPGLDLVVALLGVWRTGAVYVPVNPAFPTERLSATVADADPIAVITSEPARWEAAERVTVSPASVIGGEPVSGQPAPHQPDALAYLIYTSGTSGQPKGVGVTYRNVAALLAAVTPLSPPAGSAAANVLSPAFDGWLWSTLIPLAAGATVVLADPRDGVAELLGEIDLVTVTPSLLAAQAVPRGERPGTVVAAGEACPPALAAQWSAHRRFVNAYGPTETTICATWADTAAGDDAAGIGHPLPNYRLRVLDRHLQPVDTGTPGELFIAGAGVARGYYGMPGRTAAAFLPDPWARGERMYRTGDTVRVRPDGALEFVGRADTQVKIRGFRVEPTEIEHSLTTIDGIAAAAVVVLPGLSGATLGAAVVVRPDRDEEWRQALPALLRTRLPDFAVPARLVFLHELPTTPTGKSDVEALVRLCAADQPQASAAAAPATPSERQVARIWGEALGRDVCRVDDNFFELGGHSLVATQVITRLREETGLRLSMRALFAEPTVGALARQLDDLAAQQQITD